MFWNFVWNKKNCQSKKKNKKSQKCEICNYIVPLVLLLSLLFWPLSSSRVAFDDVIVIDIGVSHLRQETNKNQTITFFFFFKSPNFVIFSPHFNIKKKNLFPRSSLLLRCVLKQKKWDNNCKKIKQKQQQQTTNFT